MKVSFATTLLFNSLVHRGNANRSLFTATEIQNFSIKFDGCTPSYPNNTIIVSCSMTFPKGTTGKVEIREGSCDAFTDLAGGSGTTFSPVTTTYDATHLISLVEKTSGEEHPRSFCARGDLFIEDPENPGSGNLIHLKKSINDVTLKFFFPLATDEPSPLELGGEGGGMVLETLAGEQGAGALLTSASASATFSPTLEAYKCNSVGVKDSSNLPVSVGDVLYVCIENSEPTTEFSGVNQIEIYKNDKIVAVPIAGGTSDFVSSADCSLNENNKCIISTLMTPKIWDQYADAADQSLIVIGQVQFNYVSRRELKEEKTMRLLQSGKEDLFALSFDLDDRRDEGMPDVVAVQESAAFFSSASQYYTMIASVFAAAGALLM